MINFEKEVAGIEGWLSKKEGEFLYEVARKVKKEQAIVEIGSWKGRSTVCLGLGAKDGEGALVYAIDPHTGSFEHRQLGAVDTYNEFIHNVDNSGLSGQVIPVRETSEKAAGVFEKPVGFVLVDGAHELDYVKLDYEKWFPKLCLGGLMAFHDSWHWPGVHLFTAQILLGSVELRNPRLVGSLTVVEKTGKNTLADRFWNVFFVLFRFFVGWATSLRIFST